MEAKKEENLPDWYSQVTYHTFCMYSILAKATSGGENAMSVGEIN
jgi:hypothetical protein